MISLPKMRLSILGIVVAWAIVLHAPISSQASPVARHGPEIAVSDKALRSQASARWSGIGFATRMVAVNGTQLFVAEGGRGSMVILLHGYPQSGETWRRVALKLAPHYHVVVPDLRGMGLSSIPSSGYDLATVAEDIHQLVAASGQTQVAVVGHDWGGSVGAVYALRYRDEVSRLAFLESALPGAGFEQLWTFTEPNPNLTFIPFLLMGDGEGKDDTTVAMIHGNETVFLHHLWAGFTADKVSAPFERWAPFVSAMQRPGLIASSSSYYRAAYESAREARELVAVAPLGIPVLGLSGERAFGAHMEPLIRAFASNIVRTSAIPGAGHFLPEERPEEVASELMTFLVPPGQAR